MKTKMHVTNMNELGLFDLFLVLFVGLKLSHHIDWSWWIVLSPGWLGFIYHTIKHSMED